MPLAGDGGGAKIRPMADQTAMTAALGALAGLLERERARGSDAVALSPEALEQLRGLPAAFQERKRALATAAAAAKVAPAPERATVEPPARAEMAERVEEGEGSWVADTGHRIDRMDSSAVTASSFMPLDADLPEPGSGEGGVVSGPGFEISLVPPAERTEAWRREQLNRIFFALKGAAGPRELGTLFDTLVFAKGNPSADLVFVGEAPGAEEEKQKTPFVGPAGKKLEQILGAMGLSREQVYISNLVKFRPKKGDGRFQHTSNRPPTHEEMAACLPYLRAEAVYAVRHEMARSVDDVLSRRTRARLLARDASARAADDVAALIAPLLDLSEADAAAQAASYRAAVELERTTAQLPEQALDASLGA